MATIDAGAAVLRATEAQFQRTIIEAGQWHGWQWYHTQFSLGSRAGFPDLVGFNPRFGVVFAEVKSERGRVTPAQRAWLATIRASGARCWVWRPRYWPAIALILAGATDAEVAAREPEAWAAMEQEAEQEAEQRGPGSDR